VFTDLAGDRLLSGVRVQDVEVSGFGGWGISIGGWNGRSGFRDLQVLRAELHHNARGGLITYAFEPRVNRDLLVSGCTAHDNPGITGLGSNSGHGLVVGSTVGGRIERCLAYANGSRCDAPEGPVGIWTYDSSQIVIEHNESYANRTAGPADGGGFDLDQNVSDSQLQYNYSHDNDGAGLLLSQTPDTPDHSGNVVRYNISENDGRRNGYGAIHVWGRIRNAEIYNNTVYVSAGPSTAPPAVAVRNLGIPDRAVESVHLRNNLLLTAGLPLVQVADAQLANGSDLLLQGNSYWDQLGSLRLIWGASEYSSLTEWRGSAGQERIGAIDVGLELDPLLVAPGAGGTIGDPYQLDTLSAYQLRSGSALVDQSLDLAALFGVDPGPMDFWGGATPQGPGYDVGAHELPACSGPPGPVGNSLKPIKTGLQLLFFWSDVALATHYQLRQDSLPDGGFSATAGTAASGEPGLAVDNGPEPRLHYRVAAENGCGVGPL
jgi:hypothetical protein